MGTAITITDWLNQNPTQPQQNIGDDWGVNWRIPGYDDRQKYLDLYTGIANGAISVAPSEFDKILTPNSDAKTIDVNEWSYLSPETQAWAKANPQAFMQDVLAHRNPANQDLMSIGAEGGYTPSSMKNVKGANGQMDWSGANYLDIHDEGFGLGALLPIALSFIAPGLGTAIGSALGAEGLTASVLGNAVVGGATSGLTGGNVLTGALSGGLGGGLLGGISTATPAEFVDTLGGLTDATGTALPGWGGSAAGSVAGIDPTLSNFLDGPADASISHSLDSLDPARMNPLLQTQSPAPVSDATLSWVKPGTVTNMNGTNYIGSPFGTPYSIGSGTADDLVNTVSNRISSVPTGAAKLAGTLIGGLVGGSTSTSNNTSSASADNIGTGNNLYHPSQFSYTAPTWNPYTGGLLFGQR